ncbi:hypothetical protein BC937DRAFT_90521 [Endogone sp. FLAS-F59071]|nr:hypothetical protein BC937DRAFT_90521 [Endogone sp. FLAS-F59071]|eukprot:RUS17023.1 hypothetical protein BC937DRAFT_90521 [Endogone sp. FLAS-F59071]
MPPKPSTNFRLTVWDPLLIVSQIIALQALYYFSASLLTLFFLLLTGSEITLDYILNYREIRSDTVMGWTIGLAWLINSVVGIYLLLILVQRAKLILDFSLTLHIFHLIVVSYYSRHLPTNILWWILNIATCCIMTFGGEWACMRREMEPIMLSQSADNADNARARGRRRSEDVYNVSEEEGESSTAGARRSNGLGIGMGLGMGAKGKGKYEMVPLEEVREGGAEEIV